MSDQEATTTGTSPAIAAVEELAGGFEATTPQEVEEQRVEEFVEAVQNSTNDEAVQEVQVDYSLPRQQRVIGPKGSAYEGFDRTYVQRRLSYLPKLEFVQVAGKALRQIIKDFDPEDVEEFLDTQGNQDEDESEAPQEDSQLARQWRNIRRRANINMIGQAFAALGVQAPDLIISIYMIALSVPKSERPIVEAIWNLPEEEDGSGGLSDEDGFAIMRTFTAQNADAVRDFFREAGEMVAGITGLATAPSDSSVQEESAS